MIDNNPFRILGVTSNASSKDILKNISKIKAFSSVGKDVVLPFDNQIFGKILRNESILNNAKNSIQIDDKKIENALFWFVEVSGVDNVAINNIKNGNFEKSFILWENQISKSSGITKSNYSSFINLSTLKIASSLHSNPTKSAAARKLIINVLVDSIKLKSVFAESKFVIDYGKIICGENYKISSVDFLEIFIDKSIELLNKLNFKDSEIINIFSKSSKEVQGLVSSRFVNSPIKIITDEISKAAEKTKANNKKAGSYGRELMDDTKESINALKNYLGLSHFNYKLYADKLAIQLEQCGIFYFNSTGNDADYLDVYKYGLKIAAGSDVKNKLRAAIKHCEEAEDLKLCKLCNKNDVSENTHIRVKMHRMNFDGSYSYFKDGGIKAICCKSCSNEKVTQRILANVFAFGIYGLAAFFTSGILIGIDMFFARFSIFKWWNLYVVKNVYFNNISKHPLIESCLDEGYEYGMP